ncbi:hypothetical protein K443DRAFT_163080 [Laccaria amethystina LaAM-08-1]|uniref:Uncharacterized protein n=1 Tax=Laccaria amethystina LaAM-08-1 TaxID=1095629 RepID=A0A0C9XUM6_9AGAR|nr:hypothetical protein K443DRAFT_163080 [Laccaria amethystina LaAM-08-1]
MSISSLRGDVPPSSGGAGSDVDQMGGVSDDAGELAERRGLAEKSKASLRYGTKNTQYKSLATIVPTTSVPSFVPPSASRHQFKKKEDVRLSDLPQHLQHNFDAIFSPRLREYLGSSQTPWDVPTKTTINDLWKKVFPSVPLLEDAHLYHIVSKLIDDRVSSWRNKFAKGAVDYLTKSIFPQLPDNTKEQRALWCAWAISGSDRQQPFYYLIYEDAEDAEEGSSSGPITKGIFQSSIISAVLGLHVSGISQIAPALRSENKPIGALVLTVQAVKRDFSKDNWGDTVRRHEGKEQKQWEKITEAAARTSKQKRETISAMVPQATAASSESDFELADDDEDIVEG